ncbi:MAG: metallophosphoesterase [candidate division WOR-3 bacterium]|nr:MAG: metallophosphoesterase [candidate division WOR-3 bacterium]
MQKISYVMIVVFLFTKTLFAFDPFNSKPYLTPTSSPTNSIYINWNTENEESTIVAYGLTTSLEDTIRIPGIRSYHHVELTSLVPATEYFYQVLPDGDINEFTTFPTYADTFFFAAFGDTRSDSAAHHSVIDRMAAYEFAFMMHSGDLVSNGDETSDWITFFNVEDTLLQSKHFMPSIGNHEDPFWCYDTLFALPDSEDYYSVNYVNAHCIILNSEMDLDGIQRDWLIDDLIAASSDTTIDWIFAIFHHPPYSSGNHGSQLDVRDAWCPLFEQYGVDIVFSGHDHNYERTIPINGVVYIVTGGGGAPLHSVGTSAWTAYSEETYHFCLIRIAGKTLLLKAIKPDGTVFDTLFIGAPGVEEGPATNMSECVLFSPNPFVHKVTFQYALPERQEVCLKIYDCAGRNVNTISDGLQEAGNHRILWSGRDRYGNPVESGIYFLVFERENQRSIFKVVKIGK